MRLWLSEAQARLIIQHARDDAPREACGLIGGVDGRAQTIVALPNVAPDPQHQYYADTRALACALMAFDADGLSLIGIYHSHPMTDPIPSPADIRQAFYPDAAYLIVSLRGSEACLAAWHIRRGQVTPIALHIGDTLPGNHDDETLSAAQKTAILMSVLLAFALMIVLSLSLLPPAPEIPGR